MSSRPAADRGRRSHSLLAAGTAVAVVLATYREELAGRALAALVGFTATAVAACLELVGIPTVRHGGVLVCPAGFSYEIYFRCTGYLPSALLAIGMVTTQAPTGRKLVGLVLGVPAVLTVNLLRLVHLFLVGVARPDLFDLAHDVLWEGAIVFAVLALLWGWKRWATMDVSPPKGFGGGKPCTVEGFDSLRVSR